MTTSKSGKKNVRMVIGYAVLGLIVVVLALYLVLRKRDLMQYELPPLPAMEMDDVDGIELLQENQETKVVKTDDEWRIDPEGYKADDGEILQLLRRINSLELMDLVSVAGNYNRYDLDEDSRIRVIAYDGEEIVRQFDVGKRAATYNHTFVTIEGDKRVFHADGDFRRNFDKTKDALRDLQVLTFDPEEITEIVAYHSKGSTTLVKSMEKIVPEDEASESASDETDDGASESESDRADSDDESGADEVEQVVWRDDSGEAWEIEKMDDMLDRLHDLECIKYFKGDESTLGEPIFSMVLKGQKEYELVIYEHQEEGHPARTSENEYTFYISSWNRDNLIKMFEEPEEES